MNPTFELMYLCNYKFDLFHQGVQQTLRISEIECGRKIIHSDPCIGILIVRKV